MSLCEWDPAAHSAAELQMIRDGLAEPVGCLNEAVIALGHKGEWHLCATCAELPRFRRYRVAHLLKAEHLQIEERPFLRRNLAGWWAEDRSTAVALEAPRRLAEVLARLEK